MTAGIAALPGNEALAAALQQTLGLPALELEMRRFPDGETYVRAVDSPAGRDVVLACTLYHPDEHFLPLLLAAETLRDLGARRIGLVAPYLGYLRQDTRFRDGEGVTSRYFAATLSRAVDWLITVDPHLHRHPTLESVYGVPCRNVAAAPAVADWIAANVEAPVIVGPDGESAQWVEAVAGRIGAPSRVLSKARRGDREVDVRLAGDPIPPGHAPVLVDDIVSTARTMAAAARLLHSLGLPPVTCVGVHGVFADDVHPLLTQAGVARLVTSNTIPRPGADVDVYPLLAPAVRELLA